MPKQKKHKMPPSHKPILARVPAQALSRAIGMGLEGARYHFQELQARLTAEGMRTLWNEKSVTEERRRQLQSDVNQFHWHLRAFF